MPSVSQEPRPTVRSQDGTSKVVSSRRATAAARRACDSRSPSVDTRSSPRVVTIRTHACCGADAQVHASRSVGGAVASALAHADPNVLLFRRRCRNRRSDARTSSERRRCAAWFGTDGAVGGATVLMDQQSDRPRELQTLLVQFGAAMIAAGEPVHQVQERLTQVARVYGATSTRISAFPTYMMVTMGRGEPATLELTTWLAHRPASTRSPHSTTSCAKPSAAPSSRLLVCAGFVPSAR